MPNGSLRALRARFAKFALELYPNKVLTFCRLNKGRVHFVVVFNLTRFARDNYDYFALRSLLQLLGISLSSATDRFDDTSTGKSDRSSGISDSQPHRTPTDTGRRQERL